MRLATKIFTTKISWCTVNTSVTLYVHTDMPTPAVPSVLLKYSTEAWDSALYKADDIVHLLFRVFTSVFSLSDVPKLSS